MDSQEEQDPLVQEIVQLIKQFEIQIIPCSSMVEQDPVKIKVRGPNPRGGARVGKLREYI